LSIPQEFEVLEIICIYLPYLQHHCTIYSIFLVRVRLSTSFLAIKIIFSELSYSSRVVELLNSLKVSFTRSPLLAIFLSSYGPSLSSSSRSISFLSMPPWKLSTNSRYQVRNMPRRRNHLWKNYRRFCKTLASADVLHLYIL